MNTPAQEIYELIGRAVVKKVDLPHTLIDRYRSALSESLENEASAGHSERRLELILASEEKLDEVTKALKSRLLFLLGDF